MAGPHRLPEGLMTEQSSSASSKGDDPSHPERVFLVVVDESEEMQVALRFACRRAQHTGGRVALLYVIEPAD